MFKDKNIKILDKILIKVLFEGQISYTELKKMLAENENKLESYIEMIRIFIFDYYLRLEWIGNNKEESRLILLGEESYIRKLQLKLVEESEKNNVIKTFLKEKNIGSKLEKHIKKIEEFFSKVEKKIGNPISKEAKSVISHYIDLATERIKSDNILKVVPNCHFLEETNEYKIISEYRDILEKELDIKLDREETLKITECILGSHSYNFEVSYYDNWIEIEKIVRNFIEKFDESVEEDLKGDEKLFMGLLNHMKPAIYRAKSNIYLENSIYNEVVEVYPDIFSKVEKVVKGFEKFLGRKLNREEIAFLVVHFKSAMDRKKVKIKKL